MVEKLKEYGITEFGISSYYQNGGKLTRTENLEKKLNLLKGKPYAPEDITDVSKLNELDINEINRRIKLAAKLEQDFGIEIRYFIIGFKFLGKIKRNKKLENKLNLLKGKPYAPENIIDVSRLNELNINEINRRIKLVAKLEQDFGIEIHYFNIGFEFLGKIKWNKKLEDKLNLLKGKPYAPENITDISKLNELIRYYGNKL